MHSLNNNAISETATVHALTVYNMCACVCRRDDIHIHKTGQFVVIQNKYCGIRLCVRQNSICLADKRHDNKHCFFYLIIII